VRPVLLLVVLVCGCAAPHRAAPPRWQPQASGTQASLRGLCAVDGRVAWASGSGGTFVRTTDGGRTWRAGVVPGAASLDFRDVHAFDAQRALLLSAGRPARMYLTEDGGASFVEVFADDRDGVFFDALAFGDAAHGVAFSDPVGGAFVIVHTDDGGRSWRALPAKALPPPRDGEAGFAASGTCVAMHGATRIWIGTGGAVARVLHSDDGGATWRAQQTPLRAGAPSAGIFSLAFRDARIGIAVGGDYRQPERSGGHAARTEDGGATWQAIEPGPRGFRSCVAHVPGEGSRTWVAVGTGGADISRDDGRTWQPIGDVGYHAAAFAPGGGVGWTVGADGRVARLVWP
jgi:photosystem II stability/assembly factor-like uncharacterized protein